MTLYRKRPIKRPNTCLYALNKQDTDHSVIFTASPSAFIQTPVNTTVCLGSTAQFVCSVTVDNNFTVLLYLVNSTIVSEAASRGLQSPPSNTTGNMTIRSLTVMGAVVHNNSLITCVTVVSNRTNGPAMISSAYLSIQGQSTSIWYVLIQYVD